MPGTADGDEMRQVQGQRLRRLPHEPDVGLPGGPGADLPGVQISGGGHRYAAAALPALERANLDADFLEALAELYPTCEAFYFQNCGKLFLAEDVRSHQIEGPDRFIRFGVNVRFFNIEGTEDMLIDTVGMSTLFLPDLQYHFHGMDPNWVVNHAYNAASYILEHDNPIQDGETIDGVADSQMCREVQWKCQYEDSLIQPPRGVLDIHMGKYASGGR